MGHLAENGFRVSVKDLGQGQLRAVKVKYGVPPALYSCHTALVGKYVIEGHVPADLIKRLLDERSALAGLGVPGMPIGSPGMEGPNPQPYNIIGFDRGGGMQVYARR
ncbi:MAG: hypothetical protein GTO40_02760 [Deltaproteobacteria bacterium]|nr:hypothetical protein [Deltaproteobacteria bacterium]